MRIEELISQAAQTRQSRPAREELVARHGQMTLIAIQCSTCDNLVWSGDCLRDELSRREYVITGTCQWCQDEQAAWAEREDAETADSGGATVS